MKAKATVRVTYEFEFDGADDLNWIDQAHDEAASNFDPMAILECEVLSVEVAEPTPSQP